MIGMDFTSFLVLLVISAVVSAFLHFCLTYYVILGLRSIFFKVVMCWTGECLGSWVGGHCARVRQSWCVS